MHKSNEVVRLNLSNFFTSAAAALVLIVLCFLFFRAIACTGCPLPSIEVTKFHELGFFSLSTFGFIIFLTMIPFQRAEEKLSPGFYSHPLVSLRPLCAYACFNLLLYGYRYL